MRSVKLQTIVAATLATAVTGEHRPVHKHDGHNAQEVIITGDLHSHPVSAQTREHWMKTAIHALSDLVSPCPYAAFGTAIVNHTASAEGELICIGANSARQTGNPTHHGEIAAINNCTSVLADPDGPYRLSSQEISRAWKDLSLYTTAEPCPMCAAAIGWAGFREYVYATSIDTLLDYGWNQINISSREVFERSVGFRNDTAIFGDVLSEATDVLFAWQTRLDAPCPDGCHRHGADTGCKPL